MTFRITRHAKVIVPESFKAKEKNVAVIGESETKGIKRAIQKSIIAVPVISAGATAAIAGFAPIGMEILGQAPIQGMFLLSMAASMSSFFVVPCMIKHSINNGTKKYWPGRATIESFNPPDKVTTIEPFAEWDNVFLPFTVEAFNGVSVTDEKGNSRKPIRLHIDNYVELRTETRKQGIDYSLVEAQKIS